MTYETHIVSREGHMTPQKLNPDGTEKAASEHVTTRAVAVAVELETGITAEAEADNDEDAIAAAEEALGRRIVAKRRAAEEAKLRETEDPVARAARLEAIIQEKGWDKVDG